MSEKLKPSLRGRLKRAAGPTVLALGALDFAGTIADIHTTTNKAIVRELDGIFGPDASSEQLAKASEEIVIFYERTHQLAQ